MSRFDDVVGYVYRADVYCPTHTIEKLKTGPGEDFDGWALAEGTRMTAEENLDELALAFGIDREDERSFDTDYFPKVILRVDCDSDQQCGECGIYIRDEV
jgi:hypothetical protein